MPRRFPSSYPRMLMSGHNIIDNTTAVISPEVRGSAHIMVNTEGAAFAYLMGNAEPWNDWVALQHPGAHPELSRGDHLHQFPRRLHRLHDRPLQEWCRRPLDHHEEAALPSRAHLHSTGHPHHSRCSWLRHCLLRVPVRPDLLSRPPQSHAGQHLTQRSPS